MTEWRPMWRQAGLVINQHAKAGIASQQKTNMALRLNSCSNKKAP